MPCLIDRLFVPTDVEDEPDDARSLGRLPGCASAR